MTQFLELIKEKKFIQLRKLLDDSNIVDIAALFEEVENKETATLLFKLISKDMAAEVFAYINSDRQQMLIEGLTDLEIASIIKELYVDDTVDLLEEMPANVVERILKNTDKEKREIINKILMYPDDSAGSIMTTEFLDLKANMTIKEAFDRIRRIGIDKETINTCYVTDKNRKLIGVVSVRELLLANLDDSVENIMTTNVICVNTHDDKEKIANLFNKYSVIALPVVDAEHRLVGIITVDDGLTVIKEEATEDIQKMAAIAPNEKSYLKTSVFTHARKRIVWLLLLMLSATITGSIINAYEDAFLVIPALVAFLPMLMGTGGNSGSQTSAFIIRGLALEEITLKDFLKVFLKEFSIALVVGFVLAIVNFGRIVLTYNDISLALTVSLSLYVTVLVAKSMGFMLPMLAKKFKLDPALMSAPLIATIVDTTSVLSFFIFASLIFGL